MADSLTQPLLSGEQQSRREEEDVVVPADTLTQAFLRAKQQNILDNAVVIRTESLTEPLLSEEQQNGSQDVVVEGNRGDQNRGEDGVAQEASQGGNVAAATGKVKKSLLIVRLGEYLTWIVTIVRNFFSRVRAELKNASTPAKAGLAAAFCSLLCFAPGPLSVLNKNGVWAVVTADVVLEANVGLTISKGLNRTLGTLAAACLALGVNYFAPYMGRYEPLYIMTWVFVGAGTATMFKFRRPFKDRWNYGVAMSMLAFHILILSQVDYKDKIVLPLIRLVNITIGFLTMSLVNLAIAPKYAGSTLNELVAKNFERAGEAMERCVAAYCEGKILDQVGDMLTGKIPDDPIHKTFHEIVNADSECDKLLKAVPFEPCHGPFGYNYPWDTYADITDNLRYTLYDVIALDSCLRAEIQAPQNLRNECKDEFMTIGKECARVFRTLGGSLREMQQVHSQEITQRAEERAALLQHKIAKLSTSIFGAAGPRRSLDLDAGLKRGHENVDVPYLFMDSMNLYSPPLITVPIGSQLYHGRSPVEWSCGTDVVDETQEYLRKNADVTRQRISALSLIKFGSLLIELVAKAKYVVSIVDELAIKADFSSASPPVSNVSSPKAGSQYF